MYCLLSSRESVEAEVDSPQCGHIENGVPRALNLFEPNQAVEVSVKLISD